MPVFQSGCKVVLFTEMANNGGRQVLKEKSGFVRGMMHFRCLVDILVTMWGGRVDVLHWVPREGGLETEPEIHQWIDGTG